MKRIYSILTTLQIAGSVLAQAPEKMSFQAVIRNANNTLVANTQIGMQISILQGSTTGPAVYVEMQSPTTNANRLVTLEIGEGTIVSSVFASINWVNGPYFFNTESDLMGGANYSITGTSELLSVPYALHAKTAERLRAVIAKKQSFAPATLSNASLGWHATPYQSATDTLQVSVTSTDASNTFMVFATQYFESNATVISKSALRVYNSSNGLVQSHIFDAQARQNGTSEFGASGVAYITGPAAGQYSFRVEN